VEIEVGEVVGAGECLPRPYVTGETVEGVLDAYEGIDVGALLRELDMSNMHRAARSIDALRLPERLGTESKPGLAAACGLELAVLDAAGKLDGRPVREVADVVNEGGAQPGGRSRATHRIPAFMDFGREPDEFVEECRRTGAEHVKVKVGRELQEDRRRLQRIREGLGYDVTLSVDANMGWTFEQARGAISALEPYGVDWYEEPLSQRDWKGCRELRRETGARVMLDESVCSLQDGRRAVEEDACDLFNVRISKCGGLLGALRLIELGRRAGVQYQIGVQVGETAVLWAAGLQLAGAVNDYVIYEAGMPDRFFTEQIVEDNVQADWERRTIRELSAPGLGVSLVPGRVQKYAARVVEWS
jgi:L-alanine-DL-glutamate epimerase-like enolase superfamily enzyme